MSWNTKDLMSLRQEFIELAQKGDLTHRELCRRFTISSKTGYKWLKRYKEEGTAGLEDRSRRPDHSPYRTSPPLEQAVVELRRKHPVWGGRKIRACLISAGYTNVPAHSTITDILHRHALIDPFSSEAATPWRRFEHERPNDLWQIDFKGHFETQTARCHPLTLLDDHSRYNLLLHACDRTHTQTVQTLLSSVFERYGIPKRINADNGSPWGTPSKHGHGISKLTIWLIRLGIQVSHSRPRHPQTNGKLERFHRSLEAEVLRGRYFSDIKSVQTSFDKWQHVYNQQRPHEALDMEVPIKRYQSSQRAFVGFLEPIEYAPDDVVVYPGWNGETRFKGIRFKVPNELKDLPIALRPNANEDGLYDVYFCHQRFMKLDLRKNKT